MKDVYVLLSQMNPHWQKAAGDYSDRLNLIFVRREDLDGQILPARYLITSGLSEKQLNSFPQLEKVFAPKTGLDSFPVDMLEKRNIQIFNSHANAFYVAEHAVALAFSLLRNIVVLSDAGHGYIESDSSYRRMVSMHKAKVGILGYGHIGKCIAELLKPYQIQLFAYSRSSVPQEISCGSIKELFEKSDIVFNCLPLTGQTAGLIDGTMLSHLKDRYLINISRAEVIDEEALYNALKNRKLGGFASDVWYPAADGKLGSFPFEKLPNVVITPHCAASVATGTGRYIEDALNICLKEMEDDRHGI